MPLVLTAEDFVMPRLSFDCEELLHWWEPKTDMSFIFDFNWSSLQQLREATTMFLTARLYSMAQKATQSITESGSPRLKTMMASNPQTPADLLEFLTIVGSNSVVVRVAENLNTGKDTLTRLAFSNDPEIRAAVADNPNTPETCFKRLTNDESVDVRYRLAENPLAPAGCLYNLLRDENPYVSARARATLSRILAETVAMSSQMIAESEQRPQLVRNNCERVDKQLVDELNTICGCDLVSIEFSLPEAI